MIPAILALAQLVGPSVVGLLTGSKTAAKAAEVVSQTARALTGASTDDAALEALKADPAKMLEYKAAMNEHAATMYAEETRRLGMVNDTMRVEYANADPYVRRMRPTFGYIIAASFGLLILTVCTTIFISIDKAAVVIKALAELEWIIVAALAVIGVYVKKRSDDKAGGGALGLLGALAKRVAGK